MTDQEKLAELLFGHISKTPDDYEGEYPPRPLPESARVTRFAPSPTGFLHLGGLFAAMVARLTAHSTGGVFFLRIEDTDKKREVAGGIRGIIDGLNAFGITFDEGMTGEETQAGQYGPYRQSRRKEIYQCYAKELVRKGLAYPCFCSAQELDELRAHQESAGVTKGYYGEYARCRSLSPEQIAARLERGEPYVLRFKAQPTQSGRIAFDDLIKGKIEMEANYQDAVLLKTDGIPTYHFAHVVDDHLMRTTHVVRGDEWIASVPLHIALFKACGFRVPKYAHIAPIMKEEDGGKRKLSKRKDPEAAVTYYREEGYPAQSVNEYLLTLANSNFEEWRRANPQAPQSAFPFQLKKMGASGALFDLKKLTDVSKNVISRMTAEEVYRDASDWARQYDAPLAELLLRDPAYTTAIFRIDRGGKKPRKDLARWNEVRDFVSYFFDELYERADLLPENITPQAAVEILEQYGSVYHQAADKDEWFGLIRSICAPLGYAETVKEYKAAPEQFRGHVGDVSSVIRAAVTSRLMTPDLFEIMNLLGADRVRSRLEDTCNRLKGETA